MQFLRHWISFQQQCWSVANSLSASNDARQSSRNLRRCKLGTEKKFYLIDPPPGGSNTEFIQYKWVTSNGGETKRMARELGMPYTREEEDWLAVQVIFLEYLTAPVQIFAANKRGWRRLENGMS